MTITDRLVERKIKTNKQVNNLSSCKFMPDGLLKIKIDLNPLKCDEYTERQVERKTNGLSPWTSKYNDIYLCAKFDWNPSKQEGKNCDNMIAVADIKGMLLGDAMCR